MRIKNIKKFLNPLKHTLKDYGRRLKEQRWDFTYFDTRRDAHQRLWNF